MSISPIIYENESKTVFIIDIPASIATAQGFGNVLAASDSRLISCPPPQLEPYESTEPKTKAAIGRVLDHNRDSDLHETYTSHITRALATAKSGYSRENYCYERVLSSNGSIRGQTHDAREASREDVLSDHETTINASEIQLSITLHELSGQVSQSSSGSMGRLFAPAMSATQRDTQQKVQINTSNEAPFFNNDSDQTIIITTEEGKNENGGFSFRIPSQSVFLQGRCEDVPDFRAAARLYASETRGRSHVILLDPPWPNRSAKRKSSYNTPHDVETVKNLLLRMDLDSHILPGGFVAVWVTNKSSHRHMVLRAGGLFESWNVGLVEEWIWVKVTSSGEPVTAINGLWRKPYEVLLVGKAAQNSLELADSMHEIKRRVLIGVPDLHSRKPCLKGLVERFLLQQTSNYKAVEIFARHLVSGWFSWGDEVLKFNWDGYWVNAEKNEEEYKGEEE